MLTIERQGAMSAYPDMQASLAKIGLEATVMSPQDFAALIAAETQKWAAVVKAAGIKID